MSALVQSVNCSQEQRSNHCLSLSNILLFFFFFKKQLRLQSETDIWRIISRPSLTTWTHTKAELETINTFCESLDLVDAWRVLNPDLSRFTWRRRRPEIHCRLDFFLVNQSAVCNTVEADIMPGYKSDHSLVTLKLSLHSNARGRGFWKLNTSLLNETEFINQIKSTIQQTKDEYANDEFVDPKLLWEMIKMKVRGDP